jgi:hypothetical protein
MTLKLPKEAASLLFPLSDMNSLKVRAAKILIDHMSPMFPPSSRTTLIPLIPLRLRCHWLSLESMRSGGLGGDGVRSLFLAQSPSHQGELRMVMVKQFTMLSGMDL